MPVVAEPREVVVHAHFTAVDRRHPVLRVELELRRDRGETLRRERFEEVVVEAFDSHARQRPLRPFTAKGLANVPEKFQLDAEHRVTPIDTGDVCVNDDLAWFGHDGHPPAPASLADLAKPEYKDLLVVENPAASSPGLAFVLASISAYGEDGYWKSLRSNGVRVVDGWEQAYNNDFTTVGKSGDRPLVVSYATDPAADVLFSDGKDDANRRCSGTCSAQVEFAGVLANAKNPTGARALIDFMLTPQFQQGIPLQMYVYPVVTGVKLPPEFVEVRAAARQAVHPPGRDGWCESQSLDR